MYAVIENGVVINVVIWDGLADWAPPEGSTAVLIPDAVPVGIGWTYDGTMFAAPVAP